MNKKAKIAVITIVSIVIAIVVVAGAMAGSAQRAIDNGTRTTFLSNWMSFAKDETLLTQTVIPGAHDAGTVGMMWATETQDKSIGDMLACGARYFDIRVNKDGDKLVIFHGPIKGVEFAPIVDDIVAFLSANPSEVLLLDFQHFEGEGVMEAVDAILCDKLGERIIKNDTENDDLTFVKSLTLGSTRGKALVFWGNYFNQKSTCAYASERNYLFGRNNDGGSRKGSVLQSYYARNLNTKSSSKYISEAIPEYVKKYKASNGGFFVMQCQLTDPIFIVGPKFLEGTHNKNASNFVKNLANEDYFDCVNIIMRDYLGANKCKEIIALNLAKGNIKEENIAIFTQETA